MFLHLLYSFFFTATPTTEIYTLSLHDALPISTPWNAPLCSAAAAWFCPTICPRASTARLNGQWSDRKSTRLNSSHRCISYAVFCLKKKTTVATRSRALRRTHLLRPAAQYSRSG